MRDISDAVGILPGSLYVHIRSKEEVLLRIVERGIQNYLNSIETAVGAEAPAGERLRAAIIAHMRVLSAPPQTRVAFHQWTYLGPENQKRVVKLRRRYEELFSGIITDGIENKEFREVRNVRVSVLALIGMLNSATEWYSPVGGLTADEVGDLIADNALTGLHS
ncbi:TetR/AcrR family transcriptional regulator [Actinomadura vinacea]|uniref:TetR/AcrR family transcriptional regulator n=1 Tax=Actinomadura vinacea TaxID=115336 RepID=A0ABN3IWJ0_9ACTN